MKKNLLLSVIIGWCSMIYPCTTFLITKKATVDGSLLVGHSDDNELMDDRMIYVPAKDHPPGSKRAVYKMGEYYPRLVAPSVAEAYGIGGEPTEVLGYIDEVEHTYAYFDGMYGIMNEHQLAMGECTNATYFYHGPDPEKRILSISDLSRIALERCTQAKEAVILMGTLAEQYGYYDYGETLLVADKEEGWVFEITATPDGTSALWVAKKVPDGEVFVAANQFRIRDIVPNDPDVLYSSNLFAIAEQRHWYHPNQPLDWVKCVCPGEFHHPYYSLRRVWRLLSRINPSLKLSPWVRDAYTRAYPFSIAPEKPLTLQDAMALYRDHYEGTLFDQSKGLAAGPYGNTTRYLGDYDKRNHREQNKVALRGAWERPISVYYVGYVYVNQVRGWLPDPIGGVTWLGFGPPATTCFIPLYAGVSGLPHCIEYGSPQQYDERYLFWPFNIASHWMSLFEKIASPDVIAKQQEIENKQFSVQAKLDQQMLELYQHNPQEVSTQLTEFCYKNAENVRGQWWDLTHFLMEKYNSGFINKPIPGKCIGLPEPWRTQVGYPHGPTSYKKK